MREKVRLQGLSCFGFGFGFASYWLKKWRETFKSIITRSNRNRAITFEIRLRTNLFFMSDRWRGERIS